MTTRSLFLRLVAAAAVSLLAVSSVRASEIRLKDHTTLKADVLQTDDDSVIVRVPREGVATIDGKPLPPVLGVGVQAPPFAVKDLQGKPQALDANSGKVTVLHFWVGWCPHCRSDAPKVQALYEQLRENPHVQLLTVNLEQDRAKVDAFVQERSATYPIIFAAEQASAPGGANLPELYQIHAFPVTFIIDAHGIIRHKVTGSFVESGQDLGAIITGLLPAPPPPAPGKPH